MRTSWLLVESMLLIESTPVFMLKSAKIHVVALACSMLRTGVRAHKQALMAQRGFWNSLLKDNISFNELQAMVRLMEEAEHRATSVYRRQVVCCRRVLLSA